MPSSDPTARLEAFLDDLYHRRGRGIVPGLDAIKALLEKMGNPQATFPVIHVAGTNGKGSVCAMVESVLRAAGLKTGLYTSPHLVRFNERIRVKGEAISDADLDRLLHRIDTWAAEVRDEVRQPTFFEFTTAVALQYFADQKVDIAVVETGMGGTWDATNLVHSVVTVVTSVGLDHTEFLGDSVEEIAVEKAGIAKRGSPLVCGVSDGDVWRVMEERAAQAGVLLVPVSDQVSIRRSTVGWSGQRLHIASESESYPPVNLPLLGLHQVQNCAVAVAALEAFAAQTGINLDRETVARGLSETAWPGRLQVLSDDPVVVLDAAHNPQGAHVLQKSMRELADGQPIGMVAGFAGDKDAVGFLREMAGVVSRVWLVELQVERGMGEEELGHVAATAGLDADVCRLADALAQARAWAGENDGVVLVSGSIYLVGEVLGINAIGGDRAGPCPLPS